MRREDLDSPDDYGLLLPLPPPQKAGMSACIYLNYDAEGRGPECVCCDAAACALPLSCMPCSGLHYLPSAGAACALPALTGGLAQLKFKFSQTRQQQKKKRKKRI